jgi:hypothetical protein
MAAVIVESTPVPLGVPEVEDPVVEQAKGILAVMFAITPEEALLIMQAFAGVEYPTLAELAAHVVAVATEPPGGPDVARERLTLLLFAPGASAPVVSCQVCPAGGPCVCALRGAPGTARA